MKKLNSISIMHRWLCTIMLLFVGLMSAMANTSTYYYQATVTAKLTDGTTGGGKVYVTTNSQAIPDYTQNTQTINGDQDVIGDYGTRTFYYYASADDGFLFSHWTDGTWNNTTHAPNSTDGTTYFNTSRKFDGSRNNRTKFQTFAIFKKQTGVIKVQTTDANKGSVAISDDANQYNDEVTLTAIPDAQNGIKFLGWRKNNTGTGDCVSTNNPYTLVATRETEGTYYAYFSEPAEVVYCRIQNNKTGNFLSVYGSKDKRATNHTRTIQSGNQSRTRNDGFIFTNCLKLISKEEAQGNPTTVFKLQGSKTGQGTSIGVNLTAQDASYKNFVNNKDEYELTLVTNANGTSHIYTPFTLDDELSAMNSYFCDERTGWLVMKTTDGLSDDVVKSSEWTVYILDENTVDGAFGANTKEKYKKEGEDGNMYYYTTMYTDFPYKLLDGVNAYYLVFNAEFTDITDRVVFTQVEGGIVPANTAVVLECPEVQNDANLTTSVTNRLLPTTENASISVNEGDNIMKGYISRNGEKVANNKERMYVLSFHERLGFFHSSSATMTPNKAYLLAPVATREQSEYYAKKLTFSFGEPKEDDTPTEIVLSEEIVDDADAPVFDLNGRKVAEGKNTEKLLRQGIYVKKGKKFVVK